MLSKHHKTALEKEFELERVSLFSDAVFAIAITLLVIDIKWPELPEKMAGVSQWRLLLPMLSSLIGFGLSFFFIGRYWSQHLRLFKLLQKYDQGLINRNLLFLVFIVTFPFTTAGMFGHIRDNFILPLYFYIGNLVLVAATYFNLCRYLFRSKPYLTIEGEQQEKKYLYVHNLGTVLAMIGMAVVVGLATIFSPPDHKEYIGLSCVSGALFLRLANRKAGKLDPVKHS